MVRFQLLVPLGAYSSIPIEAETLLRTVLLFHKVFPVSDPKAVTLSGSTAQTVFVRQGADASPTGRKKTQIEPSHIWVQCRMTDRSTRFTVGLTAE